MSAAVSSAVSAPPAASATERSGFWNNRKIVIVSVICGVAAIAAIAACLLFIPGAPLAMVGSYLVGAMSIKLGVGVGAASTLLGTGICATMIGVAAAGCFVIDRVKKPVNAQAAWEAYVQTCDPNQFIKDVIEFLDPPEQPIHLRSYCDQGKDEAIYRTSCSIGSLDAIKTRLIRGESVTSCLNGAPVNTIGRLLKIFLIGADPGKVNHKTRELMSQHFKNVCEYSAFKRSGLTEEQRLNALSVVMLDENLFSTPEKTQQNFGFLGSPRGSLLYTYNIIETRRKEDPNELDVYVFRSFNKSQSSN